MGKLLRTVTRFSEGVSQQKWNWIFAEIRASWHLVFMYTFHAELFQWSHSKQYHVTQSITYTENHLFPLLGPWLFPRFFNKNIHNNELSLSEKILIKDYLFGCSSWDNATMNNFVMTYSSFSEEVFIKRRYNRKTLLRYRLHCTTV